MDSQEQPITPPDDAVRAGIVTAWITEDIAYWLFDADAPMFSLEHGEAIAKAHDVLRSGRVLWVIVVPGDRMQVDREVLGFYSNRAYPSIVVVRSPLTRMLVNIFQRVWARGVPLHAVGSIGEARELARKAIK